MRMLRAMMEGSGGLPEITGAGKNPARTLGVRTSGRRRDIDVDPSGMVHPRTGGMSVNPPPAARNMAEHRRPAEHGGVGKDPVWELHTDALPSRLAYRPDPNDPNRHGFVEPSEAMTLNDYEVALRSTRRLWQLH